MPHSIPNMNLPVGTVIDPSDPGFTEDELRLAVEGSDGNSLAVLVGLYRGRGLNMKSYVQADEELKRNIRATAKAALDHYRGIYRLLSPAGHIGRRNYYGLAAAKTGAWFSNGSRIVLLVDGSHWPNGGGVERFLGLFPDDEALVRRLMSLSLRNSSRPDLDTPGWIDGYLSMERKRIGQRALMAGSTAIPVVV